MIETERLILRNYTMDDFAALYEIVSAPETGEFIGDCGIIIENIYGELLPEISYHINKKYLDPKNKISYAYSIKRAEWEKL